MTWANFDYEEFACKCGNCDSENRMSESVIGDLQEIRTACDFPFIITSGYRCKLHPIEVAKSAPGPHNTGLAVDIAVFGADALAVMSAALMMNAELRFMIWRGFGLNQKGEHNERIFHLDQCESSPGRPRSWIWTY